MEDREEGKAVAGGMVGIVLVCGGILALWENEGRFNYFKEARKAAVITDPSGATPGTTVSLTGGLDTTIPIPGHYVDQFTGYHVVWRKAEIYSWHARKRKNSTTWSKGWYERLESNSKNSGLRQTLSSKALYPPKYQLGELEIRPRGIHVVDTAAPIFVDGLSLSDAGKRANLTPAGGYLYKGTAHYGSPQLGDERISYRGVPHAPTATYFGLIENGLGTGKQFNHGHSLVSRLIQNDGILHHLVNGERGEALLKLHSHYRRITWLVRGGGTAAIVFGISLFFSGFVNLLYAIPLLGRLAETAVFVASLVAGFGIALAVMLASLAFHHPLTAAIPLALVALAVYGLRRYRKAARTNVGHSLDQFRGASLAHGSAQPPSDFFARRAEQSFKNLAKVALADGTLSKKENRYLVRWGQRSGLTEPQMKTLFADAKQEGGPPQVTDRADLSLLACLAMADGRLSTKELSLLNTFGKSLGMSTHDVRTMIVQLESKSPVASIEPNSKTTTSLANAL